MRTAIFALLVLCACSKPAVSPSAARADERAAVVLAKDVWVLTANACVNAAEETGNDVIRQTCAKSLVPAHDLIETAAKAVDATWSPKAACDLVQAAVLIEQATAALPDASEVKTAVEDALAMAKTVAGANCSDAGAP